MSSPIKGYPSDTKGLEIKYQTVEPIRQHQHGSSVLAHASVRLVGTDAVEALSTQSVIVATAHAALVGDVIRFTSGVESGKEVKVFSVATNSITLVEDLPTAPVAADTFEILRHKYPLVGVAGGSAANIQDTTILLVAQDMSASFNSAAYDIRYMKGAFFQVQCAGTPVGTFTIQASTDQVFWGDMSLSAGITALTGAAQDYQIDITTTQAPYIRLAFVAGVGSVGTMNLQAFAKGI